jgi:hypothetical protein
MEFSIKGQVKRVLDTQVVSDKFSKREIHIVVDGATQYPQIVSVELNNDRCKNADDLKEGQDVEVFINLRGREWTDGNGVVKAFNTLQCWKINKQPMGAIAEYKANNAPENVPNPNEPDDLPF